MGAQKGLENPPGTLAVPALSPESSFATHTSLHILISQKSDSTNTPCMKVLMAVRHMYLQNLTHYLGLKALFYFFILLI